MILEDDFVEIGDTLRDPLTIDNPLCCGEPGLRFHAGALLRLPERSDRGRSARFD